MASAKNEMGNSASPAKRRRRRKPKSAATEVPTAGEAS